MLLNKNMNKSLSVYYFTKCSYCLNINVLNNSNLKHTSFVCSPCQSDNFRIPKTIPYSGNITTDPSRIMHKDCMHEWIKNQMISFDTYNKE